MHRRLTTVLLAGLLYGGAPAAWAQSKAEEAKAIPVHESITSTTQRYEVVKRLWIESWRSPLAVPRYDSREEAMAVFREHAVSLGGNGVINFACYALPGFFGSGTRLACNGTVVRFL